MGAQLQPSQRCWKPDPEACAHLGLEDAPMHLRCLLHERLPRCDAGNIPSCGNRPFKYKVLGDVSGVPVLPSLQQERKKLPMLQEARWQDRRSGLRDWNLRAAYFSKPLDSSWMPTS